MNEELLPEMMKLGPSLYKKIRQEDLMNDINALEENPEWQEMLDKSGITDKLKELTDLQMEGADVFMSTFSHLKRFKIGFCRLIPIIQRCRGYCPVRAEIRLRR